MRCVHRLGEPIECQILDVAEPLVNIACDTMFCNLELFIDMGNEAIPGRIECRAKLCENCSGRLVLAQPHMGAIKQSNPTDLRILHDQKLAKCRHGGVQFLS